MPTSCLFFRLDACLLHPYPYTVITHLLGCGELQGAGLLGDNGALLLGREAGHQPGDVLADLLGVQVTGLLGHIHQGGEHLIVALLRSLLKGAASTADLNGQLLALGVTDKLARRLLHILGGARGLIYRLAHLLSLAIALLNGKITH